MSMKELDELGSTLRPPRVRTKPFEADKDFYVPSSPPAEWLRTAKRLTGVSGPDAGVLWAAFVACLSPARGR